MKTFNVKQTASMLGYSQSYICKILRNKGRTLPYIITEDDLELINSEIGNRKTTVALKAKRIGIRSNTLKYILNKCKISVDHPKLERAVSLWRTKEFTFKGIQKRIKI